MVVGERGSAAAACGGETRPEAVAEWQPFALGVCQRRADRAYAVTIVRELCREPGGEVRGFLLECFGQIHRDVGRQNAGRSGGAPEQRTGCNTGEEKPPLRAGRDGVGDVLDELREVGER